MIKPNLLFPTPVWTVQFDNYKNVNETMYDYIKFKRENDKIGINKSNVKGWHSNDFDLNDKEIQNFIAFILPSTREPFAVLTMPVDTISPVTLPNTMIFPDTLMSPVISISGAKIVPKDEF